MDLWDSVPRYSVSRQSMNKARIEGEFLREHEMTFQHRGRTYTRTILPARVIDLDGKYREHYPSATEELIETRSAKSLPSSKQAILIGRTMAAGEVHASCASEGTKEAWACPVISADCLSPQYPLRHGHSEFSEGRRQGRRCNPFSLLAPSRSRFKVKLRDDPDAKWGLCSSIRW